MGANVSGGRSDCDGDGSLLRRPRFDDIPESCVALVLMRLDPTEICNLAGLNQAFHRASLADFIWESKLPSNYRFIAERALGDTTLSTLSKKEIYSRLTKPNSIDDATKVYMYSLFFRLQLGRTSKRLGRRVCNSEQIHGWDIKPARFQLTTSDGQHANNQCYLDNPGSWVLYHVGDFDVENPNAFTKIKFSMTQIDCTHTKGGLCVDSVLIYPRCSSLGKEVTSWLQR
ncbi:hypothetical protein SLEP1_g2550 [Rubroshorea leprosula]|uniref:F-box domain-containing protein n=1 Tax=Rubroshorea leprosula TaxID=152421 RepID=A0AAV5HHI9_9ROSI|nr:hypothetical protein SLEP1_g2550 [Rubroshorea leprosula]